MQISRLVHVAISPQFFREEMPEFVIHEYCPLMDSSNMTPADWVTIARDIEDNYSDYDGFVILHGTDTMAYTASALSFMLQNLNIKSTARKLSKPHP